MACINIASDRRQVAGWEQMLGGKAEGERRMESFCHQLEAPAERRLQIQAGASILQINTWCFGRFLCFFLIKQNKFLFKMIFLFVMKLYDLIIPYENVKGLIHCGHDCWIFCNKKSRVHEWIPPSSASVCCTQSTTVWPVGAGATGMTYWCFPSNVSTLRIPTVPQKVCLFVECGCGWHTCTFSLPFTAAPQTVVMHVSLKHLCDASQCLCNAQAISSSDIRWDGTWLQDASVASILERYEYLQSAFSFSYFTDCMSYKGLRFCP